MILASNYCTPEILHLILVEQANLVIKHFEYRKNLENLFQLLEPFYVVENFDTDGYNEGDFLPFYFQQLAHDWKRCYLYIPADNPVVLTALLEFPQLPFIVAQQDPEHGYDYDAFSRWAIYNNKTHTFEARSHDPPFDPKSSSFSWVSEYLVPKVTISVVEAQNYLAMIRNAMTSVYELMADFHPIAFQRVLSPFDATERRVIILLTETYFQVNLEDMIPSEVLYQVKNNQNYLPNVSPKQITTQVLEVFKGLSNDPSDTESDRGLLAYLDAKIDKIENTHESLSSLENHPLTKSEDLEGMYDRENLTIQFEGNEISWEFKVQTQYAQLRRTVRCSPENVSILHNSTNVLLIRARQFLK